jgi:hypothetical protein
VNDSSLPPPDWESVFHRARRKIFGRLLIVGTLAALGATLLLSGGLTAQGSVTWGPLPGHADDQSGDDHKQSRGEHHGENGKGSQGHGGPTDDHDGNSGHHNQKPHKHDKNKKEQKYKPWEACGGDSAGTQYCDAPPQSPDNSSSGATGVTGATGPAPAADDASA